jgi:signal transduction histidine kinase
VENNVVMFTWEGRPATLNFLTDITERRKAEEEKKSMEEQLRLAGRLAAVGELSAGVAHELNNPLAAIQGYAQFLTMNKELEEGVKKDVDIIYREALRASKITQNLLSFARQHEPSKSYISLNDVLDKALELRTHQMKVNNIELVKELAPDLPNTMADFYKMQQVFLNVVVNSEQAMTDAHGRGKLTVRSSRTDGLIQMSFTDDGPGISEENMKKIFDPFFTTKEVGKGTGLGLSICYGIVESHGGRLYARSKLGEGTTFFVEIPIVAEGQQR